MTSREQAKQDLIDYRSTTADRDRRIHAALAVGLTKTEIHTLSGIGRATIDRALAKPHGQRLG